MFHSLGKIYESDEPLKTPRDQDVEKNSEEERAEILNYFKTGRVELVDAVLLQKEAGT